MNKLCISIPEELKCYQKKLPEDAALQNKMFKSGVSVVKNNCGKIEHVDYYTSSGELLKRVIYDGSSIMGIQHYRNNHLYIQEDYKDNLLISKRVFDKYGKISTKIYYEYNRENLLTGIRKLQDYSQYRVQYGYDELGRVNSRQIFVNTEIIEEQKYKYDIFDRIVEYKDRNQSIRVTKINQKNELVTYVITDKVGNEITISNIFIGGEYQKTEVLLNGHSMVVKDKMYMDNIMLKKPYISEDDLDLAISNILKTEYVSTSKRLGNTDNSAKIINQSVEVKTLPINARKLNYINLKKQNFTNV